MARGVPHYFRDGSKHTGGTHKMPNGEVHSGASHGANFLKQLRRKLWPTVTKLLLNLRKQRKSLRKRATK
jgi:hypothetical protein